MLTAWATWTITKDLWLWLLGATRSHVNLGDGLCSFVHETLRIEYTSQLFIALDKLSK